ncbi:MAG: dTDP-4-dehydrorhamnose reductase [Gammaproteobacteria bacterium]|jgi:dTDP-4-dehydrorhamnose reductase|nr:dTDP-4-dehydrorhamnose reductase [Gammaproteobacteria bacterium]
MKILLFGRNGQVGNALGTRLAGTELIAIDREEVDLADAAATAQAVRDSGAEVVINAAAYTQVDRAEQEEALATVINADAPGVMAAACKQTGARFIHYSTDYVFDGSGTQPLGEDQPVSPLGVYGRSKLAGEQAVAASGAHALVFRTAWVYSNHGHNFLLTMLRLGADRDRLTIVNDQVGSPTWAGAIADATLAALAAWMEDTDPGQRAGTYHLTNAGQTSWWGFARAIFDGAGINVDVQPVSTADYLAGQTQAVAPRPAYSVLSNAKLQRVFGVTLPPWQDSLAACLEEGGNAH